MASYEETVLEPINGVVQPPFIPPPNKLHRNTNQLQFISNVAFCAVWNHQFAWPFRAPINAVALNLPDYHEIIRTPMDLETIKKRLENHYYYSASECIQDFETIFKNCYTYNPPEHEVVSMAKALEEFFLAKIAEIPEVEEELPVGTS